ncbi:MAG: sulfatase-like hydrolase/transferase [Kiritimatiellae bacterium]|nr:sulfatase-like hydrolase/transferase [Kiritimatiellia bacterium]
MKGRTSLIGVFALAFVVVAAYAAPRHPNVLLILSDDQGVGDVAGYGATDLETPALDRLALEGARFERFYAAAPVCSPSRASVLTGRWPRRAGVPANVSSQRGRAGMPGDELTLAEVFRSAGYRTAHLGKWHLGYTPDTMPNAQGFDVSVGHMGGCIDNWSHFFYWEGPNRHDLHRDGAEILRDGRFFPDLIVDEAEALLRSWRDHPWFLYVAFNLPHYPYQPDERWLRRYAQLPYPRNLYAAVVSTMDERIGRLLNRLDELGLARSTIVVFQSDNGHSREERAHFGGGSAGQHRGAKFSLFEGGIRVPAIVRWPGRVPAGRVIAAPAHAVDWLPTLAELAGVPLPARRLDGVSLAAVLCGEQPPPTRVLHFEHGEQWAVIEGEWKLIANPHDTGEVPPVRLEGLWLFNLGSDPAERQNLAARQPELVARLRRAHDLWAADLGRGHAAAPQ